jgi:hypothetical protein
VWWSGHFTKYCDNAVDPAFGECFDNENEDQQPVAPDDATDFANDSNDDQIDYQSDAPNDGGQNDAPNDVEQNDGPIARNDVEQNDAPNDGEQNDAPIEQNDAPVEQNDAPIEAPNSLVVSSTWYVNLANTFLHLSFAKMISQPFMCLCCTALW